MKYSLILASGSPRRKEILERQGLDFEVVKSTCEEKTDETEPAEVVKQLSKDKALDVKEKLKGWNEKMMKELSEQYGGILDANDVAPDHKTLVLAADTVVSIDGEILGKPGSEEEAMEMLRMLQGKVHQVYTGVTVIDLENEVDLSFSECTKVELYPMDTSEIIRYIGTGEPMDKAGSYGIQGCFAVHVKGIEGDYDNVVGLPIARLYQELRRAGIKLF